MWNVYSLRYWVKNFVSGHFNIDKFIQLGMLIRFFLYLTNKSFKIRKVLQNRIIDPLCGVRIENCNVRFLV